MLRLAAGYEPDDGVDGADWLGVDGADALLAPSVLVLEVFAAGLRPWKPHALPLGWPRRRRVR
jgi:hypothetical protein